MFEIIQSFIEKLKFKSSAQSRINILFSNKCEFVRLSIPNELIPMIESLARYGIVDNKSLLRVINKQ